MHSFTFYSVLVCLLVACCWGKHTLHVDNIVPSATNTVVLREVTSEVYRVDNVDLKFINLNLQGEAGLITDTPGPILFDGGFVGFDSPNFVNVTGGNDAFLSTPETLSLSGDTLNISALRFMLNTGGDIVMNTDSSIFGSATRVGINSLSHTSLRVAQGPLELLADDDLDISALHVELVGDDRISLYSFNALQVDTVNDFQAYSSFIDFDTFGDIRLTTQTGNIHLDTVRDVIFEAEDIHVSAPVGVDFQSEHGEIHVDVADHFTADSSDIVFIETVDELRYVANNEFSISTEDLLMTPSESINFRARTLESVFRMSTLQSHTTEITTGGDITMLLNAAQQTSYSFTSSNSVSFDSRNVNGDVSTLSFEAQNEGNIEFATENELDSTFTLNSNDLFVDAAALAQFSSSAVRMSSSSFSYSAGNDIDLRADSAIGDAVEITAADDIDLRSDLVTGEGEFGLWRAEDTLTFTAVSAFEATAGPDVDEDFGIRAIDDLTMTTDGELTHSAQFGTYDFDADEFEVTADTDILLDSFDKMTLYSRGGYTMTGDVVAWNLDEASFDSDRITITSTDDNVEFHGAVIDFWVNGGGSFTANRQIEWDAEGKINFHAFEHINISDLRSLKANLIAFEALETADFVGGDGINFFNEDELFVRANSRSDLTFNGNHVIIEGKESVEVTSGFVVMRADENVIVDTSDFTIATTLEENVNLLAAKDIDWTMMSGEGFATSSDDILFSHNDIELLVDDVLRFTIEEDFVGLVLGSSVFFSGDSQFTSSHDVRILANDDIVVSATTSTFDFERTFTVDVEGDADMISEDTITYTSSDVFEIRQQPGPASIDDIAFTGNDETITLTGSYSQSGGSTTLKADGTFTQRSSERILVGSTVSSAFTIDSAITFDSSSPDSNIRIESNDLVSRSNTFVQFLGGQIDISSAESEYIDFRTTTSNVLVQSNNKSPITWDAAEEWNVTALAGLKATSNGMKDGIGMLFSTSHPVMSEMKINSRDNAINAISLDSQTFTAKQIDLEATGDITYTNFFPPATVGGVLFTNAGSSHDGKYEDFTGISMRTSYPDGNIHFRAPLGSASVFAGEDLRHINEDARSFWTANSNITFLAQNGDIDIMNHQGDVLFQSDKASVTFDTNANTELQASQSIHTLAGKAISLVSTAALDPQHPDFLSFEFSALEGNIVTTASASQPIFFEGTDFDLSSNEDTNMFASSHLPIESTTGGFLTNTNTGIYLKVDGGDLDMTASDNVFVSSGKNFDIRVTSGDDLSFLATTGEIDFTSGVDTIIRTAREDILFRTADPNGDIFVRSEGEIRFQADGTDDNIGASQVDGIFVDAPQIQTFAKDDTIFNAGELFTVGANTRPIITFEAGGDAANYGVIFTSEGNINQEIGANFVISSQGTLQMDTRRDLDFTATGEIRVTSKGTQPLGRNVIFETEQKMDVRANDVEITGQRRVSVLSDEFLSVNSRTIFTIDVLGNLHSNIDGTEDINVDDWAWTAEDSFTLNTRGNVEFTNGPQGSISIYGDDELTFVSDVNSKFVTRGDNADLSIVTLDTNSNILVTTTDRLSDILFETKGMITASSVNEATFSTSGQIQLTAPLDELFDDSESTITLTSAEDLTFASEGTGVFQADDGLTVTASDPSGADLDISVEGDMFIQSWQNGIFTSLEESMTFSADFNITMLTQDGEDGFILLQSTRDIDQMISDDTFVTIGGDFAYQATGTYELHVIDDLVAGGLFLTTTGIDSDITFDTQGPVFITATQNMNLAGGDTFFTAGNSATLDVTNAFTVVTNGAHSDIRVESQRGLLDWNTGTSLTFLAQPSASNFGAPTSSSRNGHGYIHFSVAGVHPTDGYSVHMENPTGFDTALNADLGYTNFWSAEELEINTGRALFRAVSHDGDAFTMSATAESGSIEINNPTDQIQVDSNRYLTFTAENEISMLPFDNLRFQSANAGAAADYAGMLLQTNHPSADLRMFTTDFLTADLEFTANQGAIDTYSRYSSTFLLLDDDDTVAEGTYLISSAQASINMAAENDLIIRETSTGDIFFLDVTGEFFFTAGNDLSVTARQVFALGANSITVDAERDITLSSQTRLQFEVASFDFQAEGHIRLIAEEFLGVSARTAAEFVVYNDLANVAADVNQKIAIYAGSVEFTADETFLTVPSHRVVDFRDGLLIPSLALAATTGDPCATDNALFYESDGSQLCFCDTSVMQCISLF